MIGYERGPNAAEPKSLNELTGENLRLSYATRSNSQHSLKTSFIVTCVEIFSERRREYLLL